MFAIAFDLDTIETEQEHPNGVSQAYRDIERALGRFGFRRVQGSLHVTESQNLLVVTQAMNALRNLVWFPASVRDIRAFRVEQWSDFTGYVKDELSNR
jgi:virulence-associated protein VapD